VTWDFDVASREIDGLLDVGGPYVHGRPGGRFLNLCWGAVNGDEFAMFRWIKLAFGDVPPSCCARRTTATRCSSAGSG
jgi:hypothetical protein